MSTITVQQLLSLVSVLPPAARDDARKLLRIYVMLHEIAAHDEGEIALQLCQDRWQRMSGDVLTARPLRDSALDQVLQDMAYLSHRYALPHDLFAASVASLKSHAANEPVVDTDSLMSYLYGAVEVPASMALSIMQIPIKPTLYARLYARALYWQAVAHTIPQQAKTAQWLIPLSWRHDIDPAKYDDLQQLMKREMQRSIEWYEQAQPLAEYVSPQLAAKLSELFIRSHSTTT